MIVVSLDEAKLRQELCVDTNSLQVVAVIVEAFEEGSTY
jgi:hypothetical protein